MGYFIILRGNCNSMMIILLPESFILEGKKDLIIEVNCTVYYHPVKHTHQMYFLASNLVRRSQ